MPEKPANWFRFASPPAPDASWRPAAEFRPVRLERPGMEPTLTPRFESALSRLLLVGATEGIAVNGKPCAAAKSRAAVLCAFAAADSKRSATER